MPRKAKEKAEELNNEKIVKKEPIAKKKSATSVKKKSTSVSTQKSTTTKTASKKTTKKTSTKKSSTKKVAKSISSYDPVVEYYDLPFRYDETVVKILAQTPKTLFVYWDISDKDRKMYVEKYGDDFFNITRPYLIITNQTMNYTFEVEINDFANSWYLHVSDANCDYKIELARKPIQNSDIDVVSITSSNKIETPNDRILFDELSKTVFFRNTKTNIMHERAVSSLSSLYSLGKIYDIYDIYKELYKEELDEDKLGVALSSSNSSTLNK